MKKLLAIMCLCCCAVVFGAMQAQAATARIVDSSQMDLRAINGVVAKSVGGIPVGTVIAWPVANNPEDGDKWLECNGQSISASVYPELFALVGARVPDFRGLFLRGIGGNSAALGQTQGDAIRNIKGYTSHRYNAGSHGDSGALYWNSAGSGLVGGHERAEWGYTNFDASRVVPTAGENRPVNKAVRYLIRAMP